MPTNEEARRSAAQQQALGTNLNQEQENGQAHTHPTTILYYQRGEGSGNVFRFRVGPDYYWMAGSGPGGSLTASEEEHFYRAMKAAGVERDD
ncbi:hypothetical protein V8C43DRAFT_306761 [Trichoderma afarasin]